MRKPFLLSLLGLLAARATALWPTAEHEQQPLTQAMRDKVPGSNNATFGPVPESQQIFKIDFLEIAPLPIPTDRMFFGLLQGWIPEHYAQIYNNDDLANATFTITMWIEYPDDEAEDTISLTYPLRSSGGQLSFFDQHLSIRDDSGTWVDFLTMDYRNEIFLDFHLPGWLMRSGLYTFEVVAGLEDGTCLFAMSLTQEMEGDAVGDVNFLRGSSLG